MLADSAIAALCLGGAIIIAVLPVSRDTTTVPSDLANSQAKHHHHRPGTGRESLRGLPAAHHPRRDRAKPDYFFSTNVIYVINGWVAGDCHGRTYVLRRDQPRVEERSWTGGHRPLRPWLLSNS